MSSSKEEEKKENERPKARNEFEGILNEKLKMYDRQGINFIQLRDGACALKDLPILFQKLAPSEKCMPKNAKKKRKEKGPCIFKECANLRVRVSMTISIF